MAREFRRVLMTLSRISKGENMSGPASRKLSALWRRLVNMYWHGFPIPYTCRSRIAPLRGLREDIAKLEAFRLAPVFRKALGMLEDSFLVMS